MNTSTTISRHPQVAAARVGENERVLLSVTSATYFGLNELGARIWDQLEQPQSVAEIVASLEDHVAVDRPRLESDVMEFVKAVEEAGLIVVEA